MKVYIKHIAAKLPAPMAMLHICQLQPDSKTFPNTGKDKSGDVHTQPPSSRISGIAVALQCGFHRWVENLTIFTVCLMGTQTPV